ncbi:MAG: ankyrin repeat domain-containing protein [Gammaproteobacteria bacterium]|nr:ankyrin repeat domain-containing protein [Gammaproteobacteria bacterium]
MKTSGIPARRILWTVLCCLLLPIVANPAEPAGNAALQHTWAEIQRFDNRHAREKWWRTVDPGRLQAFIDAGVDTNYTDRKKWTPLHSAARYSADPRVLALLLEAGASVSAKNRAGDTPLHWAARENPNVAITKTLIAVGANVNAVDNFGWLPLHTAAESNSNPEIIRALLAAGSKRGRRAYFLLFSPAFLLKHNENMSATDKELASKLLQSRNR